MPSVFPAVSPRMPREVDAGGGVCWRAQVKTAPAANRSLTAKTVRSLDGWS